MDASNSLELWGGVECTWNRVHNSFFDQLEQSGHRRRYAKDLGRFASLGLRRLRTALRWEEYVANGSWEPFDDLLKEMDRHHIEPIVGLLHHGSGPVTTDLLDPAFPEKLAAYALAVATRYPHLVDYTPVNEPQTTARFACLYGFWFPHAATMPAYLRALINQIKGVALSMQAIRSVQPAARLIHTEDGGETFSTAPLETFRVEREHRRWLGTDLLCGCVKEHHPLFGFLIGHGIPESDILWFSDNPCPPSVLGLNYYVTSDRFLDHRTGLYTCEPGGDTGAEPLVDAEAVRARPEGIAGAGQMLRRAWERYHLPLAITEAHLGCNSEDQCRWLLEVWQQANDAHRAGVDIRGVTVWALLGSFGWNSLCMYQPGIYEPGVFSVEGDCPTPTPLAELTFRIAHRLPLGDAAQGTGWWRRPDRLTVPSCEHVNEHVENAKA